MPKNITAVGGVIQRVCISVPGNVAEYTEGMQKVPQGEQVGDIQIMCVDGHVPAERPLFRGAILQGGGAITRDAHLSLSLSLSHR